MSLRERATRGLTWSLTERWGNQLLTLGVFMVLSRKLDPEAFGLVSLGMVVVEFIRLFVDQGFSEAVVQRGEVDQEHLDTAFWTGIVTGAVLALLCLVLAEPISASFSEPRLAPVLRWLSLVFVIGGLSSTQKALLQRTLRFKQLAMRTLVAESLGGVVAVVLALWGAGVWSLVGQTLGVGVFGVVTLWSVSGWRPGFAFRWKHFRELSLFGSNIVGYKLLNVLREQSDSFVIGTFLGTVQLGYYSVALRIVAALTKILTSAMNTVAFPVFSRLQHDPPRMRRAFYEATQLTSLMTFPAFLGLAAIAPDAIPFAFGDQWGPSVPVMRVVAGVGILQSLTFFNGSVIKAIGKPGWRLGIATLQAACTVCAMLLVVRHGITAVAAAGVAIGIAIYPLGFWAVRRLIGVEPRVYAAGFLGPVCGTLLCVAAALGVRLLCEPYPRPVRIALAIGAGLLAYGLGLRLTAPDLLRRSVQLVVSALPVRLRASAPRA